MKIFTANCNITFSILTPTWNRAVYLQRVHKSLINQSFRDFEWIVADDGSTDETVEVVKALALISDFPISLIHADMHVGKIRMDNAAISTAGGELILWCDSDDWLLPNALQRLWEAWNSIPADHRAEYVGLTALAATDKGVIVNPFPGVAYKDVSWNDLAEIHQVTADMLFCARADMLKAHPFPEVDFVIPESVVWTAIGHHPTRLIPEVLLMKEYRAAHAISFTDTMSYNRGRAYALDATVRNLRSYRRSWKVRVWRLVTFIRYSLHGEISPYEARRIWGKKTTHFAFWLAFLPACALAVKDRLQGKVRWTHREFLASQGAARLTINVMNGDDR